MLFTLNSTANQSKRRTSPARARLRMNLAVALEISDNRRIPVLKNSTSATDAAEFLNSAIVGHILRQNRWFRGP
jgi:hypothetical protein